EVDEPSLRVAFAVEVHSHGVIRQLRRPQHVHLLLPDGQRLEGEVMRPLLRAYPLPPLPQAEGTRKLGHRRNALAGVAVDFLLPYAPKQGDVVLLSRLLAAPLTELAHLTMFVEKKPRRRGEVRQVLQPAQGLLGLPVVGIQLDPRRLAFRAVPDDPVS